jgi:bifunctional DNA-binding transcriptional regulator/antitoxin component of YhaV-PrlF toxin-antitoxin module
LAEVKVLQGYRVTIPEEARRRLKIKKGDSLSWEMRGREVVFRTEHLPASPTAEMMGLAAGVTGELEEATLEEVREKLERSSKISRRKHFRKLAESRPK